MPHEFNYLWLLKPEVEGPQTARELAELINRPTIRTFDTTPATVANQLRSLVAKGFVKGDGYTPQIYRLTEEGRRYVDA